MNKLNNSQEWCKKEYVEKLFAFFFYDLAFKNVVCLKGFFSVTQTSTQLTLSVESMKFGRFSELRGVKLNFATLVVVHSN